MLFVVFASEQLRRLFHRKAPAAPLRLPEVSAPVSVARAEQPVLMEIPKGTRYQVLRALRAMARGHFMVVAHRIPDVSQGLSKSGERESFLRSLRSAANWRAHNEVEPVLVPGTSCPWVIGRIILRSGWCGPSDQAHWVPNLRFFFLNDLGREALKKAQLWWSQLSPLERLRVMALE